jgi:hypothetical protein
MTEPPCLDERLSEIRRKRDRPAASFPLQFGRAAQAFYRPRRSGPGSYLKSIWLSRPRLPTPARAMGFEPVIREGLESKLCFHSHFHPFGVNREWLEQLKNSWTGNVLVARPV